MNKTACVFYYTDDRYDELAECAINSFKKFHQNEVDIYTINYTNKKTYDDMLQEYELGEETFLMQYIYAYEIMKKYNYSKVIILGCDTITCSRLDEFLNDDKTPILGTLNYPCVESTEHWKSPVFKIGQYQDVFNLNADVVCFNSADALKRVIDTSIEHYGYFSIQGGLNEVACNNIIETRAVDFPYPLSPVVYNARSKGVFGTDMIDKGVLKKHGPPLDGTPSPIQKWVVNDGKLYTHEGKQIKVWHYIEGLGGRPIEKFKELIDDFKFHWFNKDTIEFFKTKCDCEKFFTTEYKIKQ